MDENRKFRSRALIIKTALRFITKSRGKNFYSSENISSESLSSSTQSSCSSLQLSKDLYYHQEKHQKRKLSMSKKKTLTNIDQLS